MYTYICVYTHIMNTNNDTNDNTTIHNNIHNAY